MEVVVAKRNDVVDSSSDERQPARGRKSKARKSALSCISIEFHDVSAFWVRARDGVSGAFWFGDFQHRTAHFALNFDCLRAGGFGSICQGATYIGGPSERITVLVLRGAYLGLAK